MKYRFHALLTVLLSLALMACGKPADDAGSGYGASSDSDSYLTSVPEVDIEYEKFVLDNGLTLIVHEDHKTPIVAVNVWYHVGSKDEEDGKTGFAHLFEHLMFQGSENHDDEFFRPLEEVGATSLNGTTNVDRTNYFANVPVPSLDLLLWLESDRMGHLLGVIDQDRLDEQRGVVQNEKRQRANAPYGRVWDVIVEHTYPKGHPYSWPVIGSIADLNAASLEDVRNWFETYYGAANAVIAVAGDVEAEDVRSRVEKYFGHIPSGPPLEKGETWIAGMQGEQRHVMQDRVPQSRIYKVWNIPPNTDKQTIYLELAAELLGGGKTSRLYQRLVYEEQVATEATAGIYSKELGSQFITWVTVKPGEDPEKVESMMDDEFDRFLSDGPTRDELNRLKMRMSAEFIAGTERVGGYGGKADLLASGEVYYGDPGAYKKEFDTLRGATKENVLNTANQWLDDGMFVLTVNPFPDYSTSGTMADRKTMPEAGTPEDLRLPELQRASLSNGMNIVLAERHQTPVVQFTLLLDAGYASDSLSTPGTAALAMNMLDEGTKTLDALEVSKRQQELGASISTSSSLDSSLIRLDALSGPLLDESLGLYAEVIRRPVFPERELERLKQQTIATIRQEQATPFSLGLRVIPPLLYGDNHAYSLPLTGTGTENSVTGLTVEDMKTFHERWIRPDNATLVVVGDIDLKTLKNLLDKHFGDWQAPDDAVPDKNLAEVEPLSRSSIYLMDRPHTDQAMIFAARVVPPPDSEADIPVTILNAILGGMFTSRINMNLREEKHWSYGARSKLIDARAQRPYLVYAQVQQDKTADAMLEIRNEIDDISGNEPPTQAELQAAQNNLTLKLPGEHETNAAIGETITDAIVFGLPDDYYETFVSAVRKLSTDDVHRSAGRLLGNQNFVWVVVADLSEVEKPVRDLGLGEVIILDEHGKRRQN